MWTKPVCLICLKAFNGTAQAEVDDLSKELKLLRKFAIFAERYLNVPNATGNFLKNLASRAYTTSKFCPDCDIVVKDTCKLYLDLCSVKGKLDWRLQHLCKLLEGPNDTVSTKLSSLLHGRLATQLNLPGADGDKNWTEEIRKIRKSISEHCNNAREKHRNMSVFLDRLSSVYTREDNQNKSFLIVNKSEAAGDPPGDYDLPSASIEQPSNVKVERIEIDNERVMERDDWQSEMDWDKGTGADLNLVTVEPSNIALIEDSCEQNEVSRLRPRKPSMSMYFPRTLKSKRPKTTKQTPLAKVKSEQDTLPTSKTKPVVVDDQEWTCDLCGQVRVSVQLLGRHIKRVHEERWLKSKNKGKKLPLHCYFCSVSFAFEQQRQIHLLMIPHVSSITRGKFVCIEGSCNNVEFVNMTELNKHFRDTHSSEAVHRCTLCLWPFVNASLKEVHELTHVSYKTGFFDCPKCKTICSSRTSLQSHYVSEHTSLDVKLYKCDQCGAEYRTNEGLHQHVKTHEMEKQLDLGVTTLNDYFKCNECGKAFAIQVKLKQHIDSKHVMSQCSKCGEIVSLRRLAEHMRMKHQEGKPMKLIPCLQCGKYFQNKNRLERHIKIHERIQSEQCPICQKQYQRRGLLNRHLKDVHHIEADATGTTDKFICPECGKMYLYRMGLDAHIDAKHNKQGERKRDNFQCAFCPKVFWRPSVLNKHIERAHGPQVGNVCGTTLGQFEQASQPQLT